jgi:hypothetical protein
MNGITPRKFEEPFKPPPPGRPAFPNLGVRRPGVQVLNDDFDS